MCALSRLVAEHDLDPGAAENLLRFLAAQAEATEAVRWYRSYADFPLVERSVENGVTLLRYRDLRFRTPLPWGKVNEGLFITANVTFDSAGHRVFNGAIDEVAIFSRALTSSQILALFSKATGNRL